MKNILTIAMILCGFSSYAQIYSEKDFVKIPLPNDKSAEWYQLDTSRDKSFSVSIVKGKLYIYENIYTSIKTCQIPDGLFLGIDIGEWGGSLIYKPSDTTRKVFYVNGKAVELNQKVPSFKMFISNNDPMIKLITKSYVPITGPNVRLLFPWRNKLFFTVGDDEIMMNLASLYQLQIKGDSITYAKLFQIHDIPHAVAIYHKALYMATFRGFYKITNQKIEKLFDKLSWFGFNPNSVAVRNEKNIYVGMHNGYAKINLRTKQIVFYKHKIITD
jgi:hypothetical protein